MGQSVNGKINFKLLNKAKSIFNMNQYIRQRWQCSTFPFGLIASIVMKQTVYNFVSLLEVENVLGKLRTP